MTKVKICGLTRPEDAVAAVELGAWALGMVMWRGSERYCAPERAAEIAHVARRRAELVGVFVDAPLDDVARLADAASLSIVQLHGDEGPQYCDEVARRTGCAVIKAVRVRDGSSIQDLRQFRDIDYRMVDTYKAGVPGGTGETFDWNVLGELDKRIPLILSGGLNPENVGEAVATVRPFAVDVASGVECEPGVKDHALIRALIERVRDADKVAA
jgi:phosphoribosylanthranilate isomerase